MAKKQIRNKFRDRLADYYLTNREITKHYDAQHEKDRESAAKRALSASEKKMIVVTLIALVLLILKYLIF